MRESGRFNLPRLDRKPSETVAKRDAQLMLILTTNQPNFQLPPHKSLSSPRLTPQVRVVVAAMWNLPSLFSAAWIELAERDHIYCFSTSLTLACRNGHAVRLRL